MARYIDAEELTMRILSLEIVNGHVVAYADAVLSTIKHMPTVEVQKVKHGEWLIVREDFEKTLNECSNCGIQYFCEKGNLGFSYCPICGAKMDGGEKCLE